jgi:hypothetical protein
LTTADTVIGAYVVFGFLALIVAATAAVMAGCVITETAGRRRARREARAGAAFRTAEREYR